MRLFFALDGTLAKWQETATTEDLHKEGYFLNLPPEPELVTLVRDLCAKGNNVFILSSFLSESAYARNEKKEWIRKHLPRNIRILLVPYGKNKADYVKEMTHTAITKSDVLIDDHSKNCLEWSEAGGKSIKFLNGINGAGRKWSGERADICGLCKVLNV